MYLHAVVTLQTLLYYSSKQYNLSFNLVMNGSVASGSCAVKANVIVDSHVVPNSEYESQSDQATCFFIHLYFFPQGNPIITLKYAE